MAKVSVIIPVYNVAPYLRRNLDSVLNQTLKDIEVICVDDGSSDGSADILEEYALRDSRVKVVTQENAGAGAARNRGMAQAEGEFLSFLDSDDFFEPQMLEKMVIRAQEDNADFVVCLSDQFRMEEGGEDDPDQGTFSPVDWVVRLGDIPRSQPFSFRSLTGNPFKAFVGWAWDKLYRRSFVEAHELQFQEQRTTNDMLFVFSALVLAERISVVEEVLAHQRRDSSDSLSKTRENSWWCFHDALVALRQRLRREGLFEELKQDYINYALHAVLWNYRSLAEPTKSRLKKALEDGWLAQLGILSKPRSYFYQKNEYDEMKRTFHPKWGAADAGSKKTSEKPKTVKSLIKDVARDAVSEKNPAAVLRDGKALAKAVRDETKSFGRKVVPVGRVYIDNALDKQTKEIRKENEMLRRQIFEHTKQTDQLRDYIHRELCRRDEWTSRGVQDRRDAGAKPLWVIKCPAPEDESRIRWGDYPYALSLKKYLERGGIHVVLDLHEDWYRPDEQADVVLVLRGSFRYYPSRKNPDTFYVMWNISHPDEITDEEYNGYDLICVASEWYGQELKKRLQVPVEVLRQCTDTELFYPPKMAKGQTDGLENRRDYDYFFIGNSRGVKRRSVMWAIENHLPLTIFGSGWNKILEKHLDLVEEPFLSNDQIPEIYRHSKCTLNDHWEDMLRSQFVNNRIFDALACGLPVISDACEELRELFPDAVLYYEDRKEFDAAVEQIEHHYPEVKARVDAQWPRIQKEFSFRTRTEQLTGLVSKYRKV